MVIERKNGVNYDYILALRNNGDCVSVEQIPIQRHEYETDKIIELYEDENADAVDVYKVVKKLLRDKEYNLCFGFNYSYSYINPIGPVLFDCAEYMEKVKKKTLDYTVNFLLRLPKKSRKDEIMLREARKYGRKMVKPYVDEKKYGVAARSLKYIYAMDYFSSLENNSVRDNFIMFSTDVHGRYHGLHRINDDLSIQINTNFCFGSSSYFHVTVKYKDVELLPYSAWTRYYYAGYSELLSYTRSYGLQRSNWHHCFNFIESFINSAISDPESFVKKELKREIDGLLNGSINAPGLEQIVSYDKLQFEQELKVKEREGDERYIGIRCVRHANEADIEEYKIMPSEISMIYKMEKITGALRFLNNLRKFSELDEDVEVAINRIVELNNLILPEIEAAIPSVKFEIKGLNKILEPLEIERNIKKKEEPFAKLERILTAKLAWEVSHAQKEETICRFKKQYPEYEKWDIELNKLSENICELKYKIRKRKEFLSRLKSCKSLILDYAL